METYFVIFWMVVIPLVNWYQPKDGRAWLLAVSGTLYVAGRIFGNCLSHALTPGQAPVLCGLTVPDLYFAGFTVCQAMSCAWSQNPRKSIGQALTYAAMFIVYLAVKNVPADIVIMALYLPGMLMLPLAGYQVYTKRIHGKLVRRKNIRLMAKVTGVFGNTNHFGVYLMALFFPGIWLLWNVSELFWIPQSLMAGAIILTGCRAAWTGGFTGLAVICWFTGETFMTTLLIIAGSLFLAKRILYKTGKTRIGFYRLAIRLIRTNPIFGTGSGSFMWGQHYVQNTEDPPSVTNRVHNDYMEITVETGLIGLALFLLFLYFLPRPFDVVLTGGIAAVLVSALFFPALLETHTVLPFLAMTGILSGTLPAAYVLDVPVPIAVPAVLGLLAVTKKHAIQKLFAAHAHKKLLVAGTRQQATGAIFETLKHDPYDNEYLMLAYDAAKHDRSDLAVKCVTRMAEHFDGEVPWKVVENMQPEISQTKGG